MKEVLAFTLGVNHPSSRLRIVAYSSHLERNGWKLRMHHFDSGIGRSDPPEAQWFKRTERRLRRGWRGWRAASELRSFNPRQPIVISRELPVSKRPFLKAPNPMVLDVDDAIHLSGDGRGFAELCRRADVVVCGNEAIANNISNIARKCVVIPTAVDTDWYSVRTNHHLEGPLRVGWLGSSMSIEQTFAPLAQTLREAQRELNFELVVISDQLAAFMQGAHGVRFLKWSPALEQNLSAHIDVGIMPLENDAYQAFKCGAKLLQYMAAGLPVIASPIGVNRQIVIDGVTGYWATSPQEWRDAIRKLAGNENLRASFGNSGRRHAIENYSIVRWVDHWVRLLNDITGSAG